MTLSNRITAALKYNGKHGPLHIPFLGPGISLLVVGVAAERYLGADHVLAPTTVEIPIKE